VIGALSRIRAVVSPPRPGRPLSERRPERGLGAPPGQADAGRRSRNPRHCGSLGHSSRAPPPPRRSERRSGLLSDDMRTTRLGRSWATTCGYAWMSERAYRFGLEWAAPTRVEDLLGRPISLRAILEDLVGAGFGGVAGPGAVDVHSPHARSARTRPATPAHAGVVILVAVMGIHLRGDALRDPSTSGTGENIRDAPLLEARAPGSGGMSAGEDSVVCASSRVKWFVKTSESVPVRAAPSRGARPSCTSPAC
jgi:hypothetical protein